MSEKRPGRGRPPAPVKGTVMSVYLPAHRHDQIVRLSRHYRMSVSRFVTHVLERRLPPPMTEPVPRRRIMK